MATSVAPASGVPPIVHDVLRAPGRPLDAATRAFMEPRFGHDFSRVRVHDDTRAADSARAVNALAYTAGTRLVFAAGYYQPHTVPGQRLIAHELAHSAQQDDAGLSGRLPVGMDSASSPAEREAETAAAAALTGQPPALRGSRGTTAEPVLQRAEHGTYVSTVGDETYLKAGFEFYRHWGFPNVKRVSTVEDVLTDLDRSTKTIDRFRIVSHGLSIALDLGLTKEIFPAAIDTEASKFTTELPFRTLVSGARLITDSLFNDLLDDLRKDASTAPLLNTLGVGADPPAIDSALGIMLRAMLEAYFLATVKLDTGGIPRIRKRAVIEEFNRTRLATYRTAVTQATPGAQRAAVSQAVASLITAAPRALNAAGRTFTITQADADALAGPFLDPSGTKLEGGLKRAISEGAGRGTFLGKLRKVRHKIRDTTHIEIRGCNIGRDPSFLDDLRGFFGEPDSQPSLSAPDLYQYFFELSAETFVPDPAETVLTARFGDPASGLAQGFEDWSRIRAGEMLRVTSDRTLADLCTRYGLNLERTRQLNPEVDPAALVPGQEIWRVQRSTLRAGFYKSWDELADQYLGNKYAWPKLWAANPAISRPTLQPSDVISVPSTLLTPPIASPRRTAADVVAALRAGTAIVGVDTASNVARLYVDDPRRAKAIGDWLATQKFDPDPQSKTVKALTRLFGGSQADFERGRKGTFIQFLSVNYPTISDPIFPDDPRYPAHIIQRP